MGKSTFNTNKIFGLIRKGMLVAPALYIQSKHGFGSAIANRFTLRAYTGFDMNDGSFKWEYLKEGWFPYISAKLITHGVQKIGSLIRGLI